MFVEHKLAMHYDEKNIQDRIETLRKEFFPPPALSKQPVPADVKTCTKCGEEKPATEFSFQIKKTGKRKAQCRACDKRWYEENRTYFQQRYQENKEEIQAQQRAYDSTPEGRQRKKDWEDRNREKLREAGRRYYHRKRAEELERRKQSGEYREVPPGQKYCPACENTKPLRAFRIDRNATDGRRLPCKECHTEKERRRQLYAKPAEEIAAYLDARFLESAGRKRCSECGKDKLKKRFPTRGTVCKACTRARRRQWVEENRGRVRLLSRIGQSRRRARKLAAPGDHTPEQVAARVAYYGYRCWMCGGPYEALDHVKPLYRGGSNWPANLRPACHSCNASKGHAWPYPTKPKKQPTKARPRRAASLS